MGGETWVELEWVVPLGTKYVPFVRAFEGRDFFESTASQDPDVDNFRIDSEYNGEILNSLDWDMSDDEFFKDLLVHHATITGAMGPEPTMAFELRQRKHERLSSYQEFCEEGDLDVSSPTSITALKEDFSV